MSGAKADDIRVSTINQNTDRQLDPTVLDIASDCSDVR